MSKTISTRIKNRLDTFERWSTEGVELLPGEIAFVSVTEQKIDTTTGNVINVPAVLMKVGAYKKDANGNNTTEIETFDKLPWLSAKASDVYAWAKQQNIEDVDVEFAIGTATSATSKTLGAWLKEIYDKGVTNASDISVNAAALEAKADIAAVNQAAQNLITRNLGGLTYSNNASGFVTNVTQTNGKINVSKSGLPAASASSLGVVTLGGKGGAATYDSIFGSDGKGGLNKQVSDNTADITSLKTAVAGGVHFIGEVVTPTDLSSNLSTKTVTIKKADVNKSHTASDGDVVIQGEKEFIWSATAWKELGDLSRVGAVETAIANMDYTDTTALPKFVVAVNQQNGKITVSKVQPEASHIKYSKAAGETKTVEAELDSHSARLADIEEDVESLGIIGLGGNNISEYVTLHNNAFAQTLTANDPSVINKAEATEFIATVSQTNGVVAATKAKLPTASTSKAGIVQLNTTGGAVAYSTYNTLSNTVSDMSGDVASLNANTLQFDSTTKKLYAGTNRTEEIIFDCGGAF